MLCPPRRHLVSTTTIVRTATAVAAVALTLGVAACAAPTAPGAVAATATGPAAPSANSPTGEDPVPLRTAQLSEILHDNARTLLVPGAVALLRMGDTEIIATYGMRSIGSHRAVTADDHIRVGSNTKTMTTTVILQLIDEGALDLADPVSDFRPDVPGGDKITIAHLLEMRSGLGNYSETYALNAALDADPARVWEPEELIALGLSLPRTAGPGGDFHYSNTNTALLGRIIEDIEQAPLADVLRDRLFVPFSLTETTLPAPSDETLPAPFARGYMYTDNVRTLGTAELPPDLLQQAKAGTLLPGEQTFANPTWAWAAGGVVSTAHDLADWAEILAEGDALSPELHQTRIDSLRPISQDSSSSYGLGLAKLGPFLGHTGELPGYNSFMGHDPDADVTLIVWTSLAPAATGEGPATTVAHAILAALYPGT